MIEAQQQTEERALAAIPRPAPIVEWNAERAQLFKDQINPQITDAELELFGQICHRTGLDPFRNQIYAIHRRNNKLNRTIMTIQTGIDGYRVIASRIPEYAGQVGPEWCGKDGVWRDVWLEDDPPAAARVGVLRHDWPQPLYRTALWKSFAADTSFWRTMPDLMLAKVAESAALRAAFPQDLAGIYTSDEMAQADNDEPARAAQQRRSTLSAKPVAARAGSQAPSNGEPPMSPNQKNYALALAREVGLGQVELTAFTEERFGRDFNGLTRSNASDLIQAFQELKTAREQAAASDTETPAETGGWQLGEGQLSQINDLAQAMGMSDDDVAGVSDRLFGNRDYSTITVDEGRQLYRELQRIERQAEAAGR